MTSRPVRRAHEAADGASSVHHSSFCIHPSVRAVLFDAVGTLLHPEPSVAGAYAAAGRRHGVTLPEDAIAARFRAALARQDEIDRRAHRGRTSQQREVERWQMIVADVFGSGPAAERIFADLWDHFAAPANWRLFDDLIATWQELLDSELRVGIASNFDDRLAAICQALPPLDRCEHLFVSSRVGWRKPFSEFFTAVQRQLKLASHEIMLIGDDMENDYHAARAAGWQVSLVDRALPRSTQ